MFGFAIAFIAVPWMIGLATGITALAAGEHPFSVIWAASNPEGGAVFAAAIAAAVIWVRLPPLGPVPAELQERGADS